MGGLANGGGAVSEGNSSTTPLTSATSLTFTGEWVDVSGYADLSVAVTTDQNGYFSVQYSTNRNDVDSTLPRYYRTANIEAPHVFENARKYARVVFTNDSGSDQTYFRLQTILGNRGQLNAPLDSTLPQDFDATAVRPSISQDEINLGLRQNVSSYHKFAYRDTGLTSAGGEQTVWAANANFTVMTSADTFTITYNNATDGLGTTGALSLLISYIDENYELQTAVHVLGNTGSDVTSFSGLGINRVVVVSSGTADVNTNDITLADTSGGTVQGFVPAGRSVTQQMVFHFPISHDAVSRWVFIGCNRLSGSSPNALFKIYVYNRLVETQYEVFRHSIDTRTDTSIELHDPVGFNFSGRDVMWMVVDTDQNNTIVDARMSFNIYKNVDA